MTLNLGSSVPIDLTDQDDPRPSYLSVLSEAQYNAVTANSDEPLQILAGPGSGKTRVLVSRVAWLILENKISPRDMVVVTFTNKAANEMKERLLKLIGKERTDNLVLGTFHATCARYLRRHATKIGLKNNFSICDVDEQKRFFKQMAKDDESVRSKLTNMGMSTTSFPGFALNEISKAKAKNLDARGYIARNKEIVAEASGKKKYTDVKKYELMGHVYLEYETHLREINSLDFDDLMMFGLRLFSEHGKVIANLRHVLVDEFQDTNIIQYDLMSCLAGKSGSRGSVSIVGDPDQSIYGWRSAEVGNLETMAREFAIWTKSGRVRRAFLEENYRSTGSILQVAKGVIDGSSTRIDRNLFTSHQDGPHVILKKPEDELEEAALIATEIKRLIACSGGLYNFDDFAILLRFNALSRNVETHLSQEGVPTRILGGARFFDRKEVKDLLAYMALADNPEYVPALNRVINVPKRKIGDKTVENLKMMAKERGMSIMALIQLIASGKSIPGIQGAVKNQLIKFAEVINEIRQMGVEGRPANEILNAVINQVNYEAYLKQEPDYEQRWENVKELINFSHIVMRSIGMATNSETYDEEVDLIYARDDEEEEDTQPKSLLSEINKLSSIQLPISDKKNNSPESKKRDYKDVQASVKSSPNDAESSSSFKKRKSSTSSPSIKRDFAENDFIDLLSSSSDEEPLANLKEESINSAKNEDISVKDLITIDDEDIGEKSPLRIFLEACSLSTDMQEKEEDDAAQAPKVTISTVHAAKGLEFPVVFVISVEDSTFPFYRSKNSQEELDEENRLLYVAITRAQTLCYLTHVKRRAVFGNGEYRELSPFISRIADPKEYEDGRWIDKGTNLGNLPSEGGGYEVKQSFTRTVQKGNFSKQRPQLSMEVISTFAKILNRPVPPEDRVKKLTSAFDGSEIAKSIKKMDKQSRFTKGSKGAQAIPLHVSSSSSFQYASGRSINNSFVTNDFTKKQSDKFDSAAFTNGWASNAAPAPSFTSAASLLSTTQSGSNPLQITNQNVSQNSKGPNLVSTSTKRLGMGRGPLKPPIQKKEK